MARPNLRKNAQGSAANREDGGQSRGRPWFALGVIVVLAGVVGWFWMARDPDARQELTRRMEDVGSLARDVTATLTGAASSLKDRVTGEQPRPGENISNAVTIPGAPPKLGDTGGIHTPAELEEALAEQGEPLEGGAVERGAVTKEGGVTPPPDAGRQDDAVVRVAFIDDLAKWLVNGYELPSRQGRAGHLSVGLQSANLRYGVGMKGLAWIGDDLPAGRAAALNHVFTASMLDALYRMYIDRFMAAMAEYAAAPRENGAALTEPQQSELYRLYARRFRGLSGALQGVSAIKNFTGEMDALKAATQHVVDANARYSELVFALDAARDSGDEAQVNALSARVDAASQAYRQSVLNREKARAALAGEIRKNQAARLLDDESLLYVAEWVERRVRQQPDKMDAVLQAATLFLDLAQRFEAVSAAGGSPATSSGPSPASGSAATEPANTGEGARQ